MSALLASRNIRRNEDHRPRTMSRGVRSPVGPRHNAHASGWFICVLSRGPDVGVDERLTRRGKQSHVVGGLIERTLHEQTVIGAVNLPDMRRQFSCDVRSPTNNKQVKVNAQPAWSTSVTGRLVRQTVPGRGRPTALRCGPILSARREHEIRATRPMAPRPPVRATLRGEVYQDDLCKVPSGWPCNLGRTRHWGSRPGPGAAACR